MRSVLHSCFRKTVLLCITILFVPAGCAREGLRNATGSEQPETLAYGLSGEDNPANDISSASGILQAGRYQEQAMPNLDKANGNLSAVIEQEAAAFASSMEFQADKQAYGDSEEAFFNTILENLHVNTTTTFSLADAVSVSSKYSLDLKTNLSAYDQSLGQLQSSRGAFDLNLEGQASILRSYSYETADTIVQADTSTYKVAFTDLLTSGVSLEVGTEFDGTGTTMPEAETTTNEGLYYVSLSVPLLKGLGRSNTAAEMLSNEILLDASLFDVTYQSSILMGQVISNYWNYLLSYHLLKAAVSAEMNSHKLYTITEKLVAKDARPKTALHSLKADWLNKRAQRQLKQQSLIEARETLALSLGIPLQMSEEIPVPTTEFPQISNTIIPQYFERQSRIIQEALTRRGDFLADRKRLQSLTVLEKQAENALLPDLSLRAGVNQWAGEDAPHYWDISTGKPEDWETGYSAGLYLTIPLQNNTAKGNLRGSKSQRLNGEYTVIQSARQVMNDVTTALTNLHLTNEALNNNLEALEQYQRAYEDEQVKYLLGVSTPTDIINVADQLNAAKETLLTVQSQLANAIIQFHTATGELTERDEEKIYFHMAKFFSMEIDKGQ
ncbi:TolC family protein [Desulfogranum japonicum]|uniref:TolC family protein n=1 Tax=Desulfogranum japonicum TaxID=231447 RepID=UPI000491D420|nr:TolC family protein [Desulfogranum japonicum]